MTARARQPAAGGGAGMIATAAISLDGTVYTLPRPARHADVMSAYGETQLPSGVIKFKLAAGVQGFVDDGGRFLTRSEAYKVAKRCGQLIARNSGYRKGEVNGGPDLFSEDLW